MQHGKPSNFDAMTRVGIAVGMLALAVILLGIWKEI